MAEPATITGGGIVALAIVALGPVAGEHAAVAFCALAGALWALSSAQTGGNCAGAWLVARLVFTAVVLTGAGAWLLEDLLRWPTKHAMPALAFLIGLFGHRWATLAEDLSFRLRAWVRGTQHGTEEPPK